MSNEKILVVDDSPTMRNMLSYALKSGGYEVVTAKDGEEALKMLDSQSVALILLDVIMPKLNGFQVCRKIKSSLQHKGIKIIMLTSKNLEFDAFWGKKQGADLYISKPFEIKSLLSNIASLI
ncbi:MAG: response regulator [Desulfobacteraceae bacterium]|jgi:twitching motility two-component system response regulator PilH